MCMKRLLLGAVLAIVASATIFSFFFVRLHPASPVPDTIKKQLTSTLLLPRSGTVTISRPSVKYEPKQKLLSYTVTYAGTELVLSEQPTPESFVDIPQVYKKVVDEMNNYSSFDADIGTIHLTMPKTLQGKQAAVLNTKGTLLFAKTTHNLSNDQWRLFFNQFQVER